jgi:hypothetical protein
MGRRIVENPSSRSRFFASKVSTARAPSLHRARWHVATGSLPAMRHASPAEITMKTNHHPDRSRCQPQAWIEWANLLLAGFLLLSPWSSLGASTSITWNAVITGTWVAAFAAMALARPGTGADWGNVVAGLWLAMAPWTLDFSTRAGASAASLLAGLGVACLAGIQLTLPDRPAEQSQGDQARR